MRNPEEGHCQHDSDDIRTDLQWAIQNDRVIIIPQCVLVAKAAAGVPAVDKTAAPPGQLF